MPQSKPRYVLMISDTHIAILRQSLAVEFSYGICKTKSVLLFERMFYYIAQWKTKKY